MLLMSVSIHAPVKSATGVLVNYSYGFTVSIHAPVKSATKSYVIIKTSYSCFNPRARKERDAVKIAKVLGVTVVSIHAPVKSATVGRTPYGHHRTVSIHAPVKSATKTRN